MQGFEEMKECVSRSAHVLMVKVTGAYSHSSHALRFLGVNPDSPFTIPVDPRGAIILRK